MTDEMPDEANRPDGAPAARDPVGMPEPESGTTDPLELAAERGCDGCGEDDPEQLGWYNEPLPGCSAVQAPLDPRLVLCDACEAKRPSTYREKVVEKVRERDGFIAVLTFDCGNAEGVAEPDNPYNVPTKNIRCRCGAWMNHLEVLDDG